MFGYMVFKSSGQEKKNQEDEEVPHWWLERSEERGPADGYNL